LLALLAFAGCRMGQPRGGQTPEATVRAASTLRPSTRSPVEDVAMPWEFELNSLASSFVYDPERKLRGGSLRFEGGASVWRVVRFYRDEMKRLGWRLVKEHISRNSSLSFRKQDEICTVRIYRALGRTIVDIVL